MKWKRSRFRFRKRWKTSVTSLSSTDDATIVSKSIHVTSHIAYTIFLLVVVGFHCIMSNFECPQMIIFVCQHLEPLGYWGGLCCCVVHIADIFLNLLHCRPKQYFNFTHGRLYVFFTFLISLDYIIFMICRRMIFRAFRPLVLIFRIPALRNTGLVMLGVTPKFLLFLLIFGGYVAIFSIMGVHLFMDAYIDNPVVERQHDGIYVGSFNHTGIAVVEVFVLMAGGSYPRFMIPAYRYEKYNPAVVLIFFVTIIITGEIILYGILVAKIYDFYAAANKKHVKEERHHERQCLIKAFEILDENNSGTVPFTHWKGLMQVLRPKASASEILKRFRKMKDIAKKQKSDGASCTPTFCDVYLSFNLYEFFCLSNVLQLTVEKSNLKRSFQSTRENRVSAWLKTKLKIDNLVIFCQRLYFKTWTYYISLALNVLFLIPFVLTWSNISPVSQKIYFYIQISLLAVITLEVLTQFIVLGTAYMCEEMLLHISMVAIACGCFMYCGITKWPNWNEGWIAVLAYLCMVVRLTSFKRRTSSTFHWLRRIAPPFFTLFCLTLIAFYTYGIIGMECFGHLELDDEEHDILPEGVSLCDYGFETLGCTLLTLFQISLGSSWHKVMHYIMDEINNWCCIYFIFFYAFMQMLLLNIISAIIVELANAIALDESEAKQRDKEMETKDESKLGSKLRQSRQSTDLFSKRTSSSNGSLLAAVSTTAGIVVQDCAFFCTLVDNSNSESSEIFSSAGEKKGENRSLKKHSTATFQSKPPLPGIIEEDSETEDLDEVTLTGRKKLGKWTRDILPDMTFFNAEDIKRLHAEMAGSIAKKRQLENKRRHVTTTIKVVEVQ